MKKNFRYFFAAAAIASVASCAEQLDNVVTSESDNLVKMTFSASMSEDVDSKTTYLSRKVYWEATDAITVFSVGENGTNTSSFADPELLENNTVARFSGLADASAETYYAVYPHSDANTYENGTFSVTFPAEQTAVVNGFESGSNVSVAVSTEQNLQFRNVGALLAFSFMDLETALNTASVTFKAKKSDTEYWGLAGATTFTLDGNNLPVAAEGEDQAVVVNAPAEGFKTGVAYFIPVIPVGACTGMELVYTDLNGDTYTKNNDEDFELLRSYMFNVGKLPRPYPEIELPDDFTIILDFTKGWPFHTPFVSEQVNAGEIYYLVYSVGKNKKCIPIEINGPGGSNTYSMEPKGFQYNTQNNTQIYSPAFEDRYLTRLLVDKASASRINLNGGQALPYALTSIDFKFYTDFSLATTSKNTTIIYDGEKGDDGKYISGHAELRTAKLNTRFYIRARDTGVILYKLTFTYSKTSPGLAPTEDDTNTPE